MGLILFELKCVSPHIFESDTFLAVLNSEGKLQIYWQDQYPEKAEQERFAQPWKEVVVFIMPHNRIRIENCEDPNYQLSNEVMANYTVKYCDIFEFEILNNVATKHYENPLVAHLDILESHYPKRKTTRTDLFGYRELV